MTDTMVPKVAQVRKSGRSRLLLGMLGAALALLAGCQSSAPQTPNGATLPDDATDIEVIQHAIRTAGMTPAKGRDIQLANGKSIHVDVSVAGREFGIAYIDKKDVSTLGDAIPPYKVDPEQRLRIVTGGADGQTRVLLLYYQKYDPNLTEDEKNRAYVGQGPLWAVGVRDINLEATRRERTREELSTDVQKFLDYAQVKSFR